MRNSLVPKVLIALISLIVACSSDDKKPDEQEPIITDDFIRAADVSFLPEAESAGTTYRLDGVPQNALITLKNAGCNMIRIRVWHTPTNIHSSLTEAKILSQRARQNGMKVWLTVHYSNTWADPGHQSKPAAWNGFNFVQLKEAMNNYTAQLLQEI
ncbi:MAG: glycosyl hydrolase 53 family protein, partial [Flavobacterium sp.]